MRPEARAHKVKKFDRAVEWMFFFVKPALFGR